MRTRMRFDDDAWAESENMADAWFEILNQRETLLAIGNFMVKHRGGVPVQLFSAKIGGYNISFRLEFHDGGSAIIRFPVPGLSMFPDEKVRNEVAVIRYLQEHTSIPVPFILHWGGKEESPLNLGPFILMDYIEHEMDLDTAMNMPGLGKDDRPVLDPNIEIEKLEMLYGQIADILLQMSNLSLSKIGSLVQTGDAEWEVKRRALSMPMNELVRLGSLPRFKLPSTTFETASSYFSNLADLHIDHLNHQRNDAIDDSTDCRRRYVARQLFRKLAEKGSLTSSSTHDHGSFKLWCDDFRPANILLNSDLRIVGVIDWEFTYAAPVEFTFAPPWWLLLEQPEYWENGIDDWTDTYEKRLQPFLKVLREREAVRIQNGRLKEDQRLSVRMQQSWASGDFWVAYAARKSFAFDAVYWLKLDSRFFGPGADFVGDSWESRVALLDEGQEKDLENLVSRKLQEMEKRALIWEPEETVVT